MSFIKKNVTFLVFVTFFTGAAIIGMYNKYHHIYLLSLNGTVTGIQRNIKEDMLITVSGKEYPIGHSWPEFQKSVEISDSVYKRSRDTILILIKTKTHQRIVCKLN